MPPVDAVQVIGPIAADAPQKPEIGGQRRVVVALLLAATDHQYVAIRQQRRRVQFPWRVEHRTDGEGAGAGLGHRLSSCSAGCPRCRSRR